MAASNSQSLSSRAAFSIVKAKRSFFKMSMREKVLALLFGFALAALWFSWQADRHSRLSEMHTTARRTENMQSMQLAEGPNTRETYANQISQIDLESLPSKEEVSGQIDALVRRFGFDPFDLSEARTEEGADLKFHTFQLVVNKAPYSRIKSFTEAVKTELPFVSLERIVIQAQTRDDNFQDVRYVFKSIEYIK
ncbi:hypothetical protein [Pelagicoccus albus]|uniref:Uncharacterized protein n=1 Tax=Pelagicoccus albus TaxID=415222 RepID=A0A7X1E6P1_9BACT|nr:hypothetical protein [Pelagicoccus albus]MBC2604474.1 hypothetical protein [Pelagicoccus albus]